MPPPEDRSVRVPERRVRAIALTDAGPVQFQRPESADAATARSLAGRISRVSTANPHHRGKHEIRPPPLTTNSTPQSTQPQPAKQLITRPRLQRSQSVYIHDTRTEVCAAIQTSSRIGSMPSSTMYCGVPAWSKMRTWPMSMPAFWYSVAKTSWNLTGRSTAYSA